MPGGKNNIRPEDGKQFSSENQPKRKRGKSILTLVKKNIYNSRGEIIVKDVERVEIINEKPVDTGERVNVRIHLDTAEKVAIHYQKKIFSSDKVLLDFIDRESGKAKQTHVLEIKMENWDSELIFRDQLPIIEYLLEVGIGERKNNVEEFNKIIKKYVEKIK